MVASICHHEEKTDGEQISRNGVDKIQHMRCALHSDMEYSISQKESREDKANCILCDILQESEKNETFIAKLEFGSLFLHWNQTYSGRCLYISNIHIDDFPSIDYKHFTNLNREMLLICQTIERIFQPDLINFASLGNAIKHFHYHIIPRYNHDPNWGRPPWPAAGKKLTNKEYGNVISTIRMSLEGRLD